MTKPMKLMLALAVVFAVTGAFAWDLTVADAYTGGTNIMIVPRIDAYSAQLPVRSTGVVVAAGARYRLGASVIVAAHAGTITNQVTTTTTYYTNGVATDITGATNAIGSGRAVITNTVVECSPITVPTKGISGYDGTVRWYRARSAAEDDLRLQLSVPAGSVTLTDEDGSTFTYTTSGFVDFADFAGTLYITKSDTNINAVSVMDW